MNIFMTISQNYLRLWNSNIQGRLCFLYRIICEHTSRRWYAESCRTIRLGFYSLQATLRNFHQWKIYLDLLRNFCKICNLTIRKMLLNKFLNRCLCLTKTISWDSLENHSTTWRNSGITWTVNKLLMILLKGSKI